MEGTATRLSAQVSSTDICHARLGHVPTNIVHLLPVTCSTKPLDVCDSCYFSKQSRMKFLVTTHDSTKLFDIVHVDLWGPYMFKTHKNCSYFSTPVEDMSRSTRVYLVPDKSTKPYILTEFIVLIQNQFLTTIKTLRTDNCTEFINQPVSSFTKDKGILHQTTCVYTPQQNGLVEIKHMHLLNCARALRFHDGLPVVFGEIACWLQHT